MAIERQIFIAGEWRDTGRFSAATCRAHAEGFSAARFDMEIAREVRALLG